MPFQTRRRSKRKDKRAAKVAGANTVFAHDTHRKCLIDRNSVAFKALKFVLLCLVLAAALFYTLQYSGGTRVLQSAAASSSSMLMGWMGRESYVATDASGQPSIETSGFSAQITDYCAGAVELAFMFGIIFASDDRSMRMRLWGFSVGAALFLAFNAIRISVTLMAFSSSAPMFSLAVHDVLFRASIVVFVAAYYAVWYYWENPDEKAGAA